MEEKINLKVKPTCLVCGKEMEERPTHSGKSHFFICPWHSTTNIRTAALAEMKQEVKEPQAQSKSDESGEEAVKQWLQEKMPLDR